jgi:hypothetical protein
MIAFLILAVASLLQQATPPAAPPQTPATQSAPAESPCAAPAYRQFDFWLGEWDVKTPDGHPAGTNSITLELKGCVLHEHWSGVRGMKGESFNTWSPTRRSWHQTWVDDGGGFLLLDGNLDGNAMVLQGERREPDGSTTLQRLRYEPRPPAGLRQLWEMSSDGGATWTTVFDALYTRASVTAPKP